MVVDHDLIQFWKINLIGNNWYLAFILSAPFKVNKQKQPSEVFYKKAVLKHFAIFIRQQPCWSAFLIKLPEGLQLY